MEKKGIGKEMKYPSQIFSAKRKAVVFSIDYHLFPATNNGDEVSPLAMHAKWSRLVFNIIDKRNNDTNVVFANVPAADCAYLAYNAKSIYNHKFFNRDRIVERMNHVRESLGNNGNDASAVAFSDTFKMGSLKGKTPGDIILEDPNNGISTVLKQRDFLNSNLDRYPTNRSLITACDAAVFAANNGGLSRPSTKTSSCEYMIYSSAIKPLIAKKNDAGKCFIYQITITCDYMRDSSPWTITVMNGWSNVVKNNDGMLNVVGAISDKKICSVNLTDKEIFDMVERIEKTLQSFELTHWRNQTKIHETLINSYKYENVTNNGGYNNGNVPVNYNNGYAPPPYNNYNPNQ